VNEVSDEEMQALAAIQESPDPMVRVIYHMSMRQLATSERIVRVENEVMSIHGHLRRISKSLGLEPPNGSRPDLKAVTVE
jgi:hypothetical protein